MKTELQKTRSSLQKQINRLECFCNRYRRANDARKIQIQQFNNLIRFLISENRITKDEVSQFIHRKEKDIL